MTATSVKQTKFGSAFGSPITLFTIQSHTLTAKIANYGGIIVSIEVPDRNGRFDDVVLGFDRLDPYIINPAYFGAIVGRYANRIAEARFTLHGKEYRLARNDGRNSLHGGQRGFDKRIWPAREISGGVELSYVSPDGEEGYPGTVQTTVCYTVDGNELRIGYSATADRETFVNLTNHSYFNLAGSSTGDILGHELELEADSFTPTDNNQIPTAVLQNVAGTPFDFTRATAIGSRINTYDEQLRIGRGYDHNWVLRNRVSEPSLAARLHEPRTGRVMEVLTIEPGLQFYSGNLLDETIIGKRGTRYGKRAGLCLETQHYPNSPNTPQFPSTVLKPGDLFESATIYRFLVN